jgi:hypothetical protein
MKTTALITEKSQDSPAVLLDQKSSETEGSPKTKSHFISAPFLVKNQDKRMSMPLKLRPLGFLREYGIND